MTGRPSGRCAAQAALADLLLEQQTVKDYYDHRDAARAALASPCCVSADQEQVKEALDWIREVAEKRRGEIEWRGIYDAAREALALLGSREEEDR